MIVKNEEESLPRCLDSVKTIVDEMIIVDTGSQDATVKIAESYGAKIFFYSWNDSFADARNFSISKANGDWLLIMDADDELYREDAEKLAALVKTPQTKNVFYMNTLCFTGTVPDISSIILNLNVRLIRNHLGYHFEGNIHEHPVGSEYTPNVPTETVDIRFYHYGYLQPAIDSKEKRKRNIALLEKELEKNKDDAITVFYMANEYYAAKDFETAIIYLNKSLSLCSPANSLFTKILYRMIMCYYIKSDYETAIRYADIVLSYYPGFTDAELMRGIIKLKQMRTPEAIHCLNKCLRMGETQPILSNINGAGSYQPQTILSDIYYNMGLLQKSRYHCHKAITLGALTAHQFALMYQLLTLLKKKPDVIRQRMVRYASLGGTAAYMMVSDIYYNQQQYDNALYLLEKALKTDSDGTNTLLITYYKGRCFFNKKEFAKASRCFLAVGTGEYAAKAAYFKLLCSYFSAVKFSEIEKGCMNEEYYDVLVKFQELVAGKACAPLCTSAAASQHYLEPVFSFLDVLLKMDRFDDFDKAVGLIDLTDNDKALLLLAKTHFNNKCYESAYSEFIASIKQTGNIDMQGLDMMKELLLSRQKIKLL